ncbi:uncharacterized protein BDZ99DRAFT_403312 [Mytilinidion resinicola]|uniref:Uncharacterized protein n=1 Tax=Mytilinidion resinicola TaxID=574789 RepID=A0A6A6XY82_9PEZI|nr:uncharacterized protein BDZ99DRAFT_403312 [Mytilinidion resinicola]KAF2801452.1 hypothetical protein BDZ99DRAFT_403312 [Mytilinidion resinicola]
MTLKLRATARDAQTFARHNSFQWRRFLAFTKTEAERLAANHTSWRDVPADTAAAILENVNTQLKVEKIPEIDGDLLNWRMSQALRKVPHC